MLFRSLFMLDFSPASSASELTRKYSKNLLTIADTMSGVSSSGKSGCSKILTKMQRVRSDSFFGVSSAVSITLATFSSSTCPHAECLSLSELHSLPHELSAPSLLPASFAQSCWRICRHHRQQWADRGTSSSRYAIPQGNFLICHDGLDPFKHL